MKTFSSHCLVQKKKRSKRIRQQNSLNNKSDYYSLYVLSYTDEDPHEVGSFFVLKRNWPVEPRRLRPPLKGARGRLEPASIKCNTYVLVLHSADTFLSRLICFSQSREGGVRFCQTKGAGHVGGASHRMDSERGSVSQLNRFGRSSAPQIHSEQKRERERLSLCGAAEQHRGRRSIYSLFS